jgi:hypothetical protein
MDRRLNKSDKALVQDISERQNEGREEPSDIPQDKTTNGVF